MRVAVAFVAAAVPVVPPPAVVVPRVVPWHTPNYHLILATLVAPDCLADVAPAVSWHWPHEGNDQMLASIPTISLLVRYWPRFPRLVEWYRPSFFPIVDCDPTRYAAVVFPRYCYPRLVVLLVR